MCQTGGRYELRCQNLIKINGIYLVAGSNNIIGVACTIWETYSPYLPSIIDHKVKYWELMVFSCSVKNYFCFTLIFCLSCLIG